MGGPDAGGLRGSAAARGNARCRRSRANLSAVVQVHSPGGSFFIIPDTSVAPNADCATTPLTTCYEIPQATYFAVARHAADPPRV